MMTSAIHAVQMAGGRLPPAVPLPQTQSPYPLRLFAAPPLSVVLSLDCPLPISSPHVSGAPVCLASCTPSRLLPGRRAGATCRGDAQKLGQMLCAGRREAAQGAGGVVGGGAVRDARCRSVLQGRNSLSATPERAVRGAEVAAFGPAEQRQEQHSGDEPA